MSGEVFIILDTQRHYGYFCRTFLCAPKSLTDEHSIFVIHILYALLLQILAATFLNHSFPTQDVEDDRT
jgi:hypothetical protein